MQPFLPAGKLNRQAKLIFLDALVQEGHGEWLDQERKSCLILWKTVAEWADTVNVSGATHCCWGGGVGCHRLGKQEP